MTPPYRWSLIVSTDELTRRLDDWTVEDVLRWSLTSPEVRLCMFGKPLLTVAYGCLRLLVVFQLLDVSTSW